MNDVTFEYRALAGTLLLGILAYAQWRRHRKLSRLREYTFLYATAGFTITYAIAHDLFTFALAPEYFFVLKDVAGDDFFPGVAWLAARAGWTAGLAIGLGLLIANNPGKRGQLSYRQLAKCVCFPLFWSLATATLGGLYARYAEPGALRGWGLDQPLAVVTVWGIHIGSYVGGIIGLAHACMHIFRARREPYLCICSSAISVG